MTIQSFIEDFDVPACLSSGGDYCSITLSVGDVVVINLLGATFTKSFRGRRMHNKEARVTRVLLDSDNLPWYGLQLIDNNFPDRNFGAEDTVLPGDLVRVSPSRTIASSRFSRN